MIFLCATSNGCEDEVVRDPICDDMCWRNAFFVLRISFHGMAQVLERLSFYVGLRSNTCGSLRNFGVLTLRMKWRGIADVDLISLAVMLKQFAANVCNNYFKQMKVVRGGLQISWIRAIHGMSTHLDDVLAQNLRSRMMTQDGDKHDDKNNVGQHQNCSRAKLESEQFVALKSLVAKHCDGAHSDAESVFGGPLRRFKAPTTLQSNAKPEETLHKQVKKHVLKEMDV